MEYLLELHGQAIPGIRLEGFARSIRDKRPSVGFGV